MVIGKRGTQNSVIIIVLVLAAAFFAGVFGNGDITGRQIGAIPKSIEPAGSCKYLDGISTYLQANPRSSGDKYCKLEGFEGAAYVDKEHSRILFESRTGQCSGKIQVDEIVYYYREKGNVPLTVNNAATCVNVGSTGFTEPEFGDQWKFGPRYPGVLCCN